MKLSIYGLMLSASLIMTQATAAAPDSYYLAIKGGISLGSYETGLNRTMLKYIQQQKALGEARLIAFSGASAGSINSVLSALDTCIANKGKLSDTLENNFMRDAWDIGIDDLVPTDVSRDKARANKAANAALDGDKKLVKKVLKKTKSNVYASIFSRDGFDAKKQLLKSMLATPAVQGCSIIITMSITKLEPYRHPIKEIGETINLQRFIIPVEVLVDSRNLLRFKNYHMKRSAQDTASGIPSPYLRLVEGHDGYIDFEDLWKLAMASSAFPLAFEAVELSYCFPHLLGGNKCTSGQAETALFSDGGLFDNSPIGVSWDVALQNNAHEMHQLKNIKLIYINPDSYRSEDTSVVKKVVTSNKKGLWDFGAYIGESFLTAQEQEYRLALANVLSLDDRSFYMTNRYHHLLADLHYHFGAFYAKEFRMHDYLVGIYDGAHVIAQIECDRKTEDFSKTNNRFESVYQNCVREGVRSWVEQGVSRDATISLPTLDFFRYLYNSEFNKSLRIEAERSNKYIALAKAFGSVNKTKSNVISYTDYLDNLSRVKQSLQLEKTDDLYKILYQGKSYTAEKASQIYANLIHMQYLSSSCASCDSHLPNQKIGEVLSVVEPIVDSYLAHHDTEIWSLPIAGAFGFSYGLNMTQRNQVFSLDYRPEELTHKKISTDFSLGFHRFGSEFANDHYQSLSVGLTRHNDNIIFPTWGFGYQYETKGRNIYSEAVDSLYLKGSLLNELITIKFLHRLGTLEQNAIQTREDNVLILTMDLAKICQIALPGLCR